MVRPRRMARPRGSSRRVAWTAPTLVAFGLALAAPRTARAQQVSAAVPGATVRAVASPPRTAGETVVPVGVLGQGARIDGQELLTLVPGISLTNEATAGDAPEVYLRGFAGNNGQDIAFSVEGVPLNDESNPLTHGNADLYGIAPELIDQLRVTAGLSDPRQGNFALAGSVDVGLGLAQRGTTVRASVGSHGYRRLAAFHGPWRLGRESFVGVEAVHDDGVGASRRYDRVSALGQHVVDLGHGLSLRVLSGLSLGTWQNPGVVRLDDYQTGRVGFFDVYPGLGIQGGTSLRAMVSAALAWSGPEGHAEVRAYALARDFNESQNPDGFYRDPVHGDLLRERYVGGTVGLTASWRRAVTVGGQRQEFEAGVSLRHDRYTVHEDNLDVATNAPLAMPDPMADTADNSAALRVTSPGVYADLAVRPASWLTLRGGVRLDTVAYDMDVTTLDPSGGHPVTAHRSAYGVHLGPKATVVLGPWRNLTLLASVGTGFRTPDARTVADGGPVTFSTATTEDVTLRYARPGGARESPFTAALTGFHTTVQGDMVFDPVHATTVSVGDTDRLGAMLWSRVRPFPWVDLHAWVAWTISTVEHTALDGRLPAGAAIPYLPAVVARIDGAMERRVGTVHGRTVMFRVSAGASVRGPAGMLATAPTPTTVLLDATAGVRVGWFGFDLAARNLLDQRWHAADFEYPSNVHPGTMNNPAPAAHFVAGAPLTVIGTVSVTL